MCDLGVIVPKNQRKIIQQIEKLGVFSRKEAEQLGFEWGKLKCLVKNGLVERVDTGIYWMKSSNLPAEHVDFIAGCLRFGPDAVIGGHTALFHYGLIREIPDRIWIFVPHAHATRSPHSYRIIRTNYELHTGVEVHSRFKITSIEKTLLDGLRYQSKIGLSLVYEAFYVAMRESVTTMQKIGALAEKLGWQSLLVKHWEALSMEIDNLR